MKTKKKWTAKRGASLAYLVYEYNNHMYAPWLSVSDWLNLTRKHSSRMSITLLLAVHALYLGKGAWQDGGGGGGRVLYSEFEV